jgi:ATP-binding cassette subfamily F protein uup
VAENIGEGRDQVTVQGKTRHILSYLQDFLFSPERSRTPMSVLSGGERNRALLARLFLKPSNMLVLDEPTNDLDIETLELLEELLVEYNGTVLLVSHDRSFLNNVVTSTIVFEGNGIVREYVGGYDDWLRQKSSSGAANVFTPTAAAANAKPVTTAEEKKTTPVNKPRKLSYKEQRELEELPQRIEALEREQKQLHEQMGDAAFYQQDSGRISAAKTRLEQLEQELNAAYLRWELLEES